MACPNAHECPNMMSSLPKFGMFVAVKLLFKLPTMDELNDFFNCKVIECNAVGQWREWNYFLQCKRL